MALKYLKPQVCLANEAVRNLQLESLDSFKNKFTNVSKEERSFKKYLFTVFCLNCNFNCFGVKNEYNHYWLQPISINGGTAPKINEMSIANDALEGGKYHMDIYLSYIDANDVYIF